MENAIVKELKFREAQIIFGHDGGESEFDSFLKKTYHPQSLKFKRYKKIIDTFLNITSRCILELGAGPGDFVVFCKNKYPHHKYYASELSQPLLTRNIEKAGIFFKTDIRDITTCFFPAEKISFPDEFFDIMFIRATVHHFEDPCQAFHEIYRSLKRNGKVIFFNDPIVLDIPGYRQLIKHFFCRKERARGENENIYTINEYLSFGQIFSSRRNWVDELYKEDFCESLKKWRGVKRIIGKYIAENNFLLEKYLIYRWKATSIFEFVK